MKHLIFLLSLLSLGVNAQTGSLRCDITFNQNSACATDNLVLTSKTNTIVYLRFQKNDTLSGIPIGTYRALFYDCDSSHTYSQTIEIVEDETRVFYFYNNANMRNRYYSYSFPDTNDYVKVWANHGFEFGRGLDYENKSVKIESNYSFQYGSGQDYMLNKSPFALGFDFGLKYSQYNYNKIDFFDTSLVHDQHRYSSLDFSSTFIASIYIKQKKFMDLGIKYNLPLYARIVSKNGNQKLTTRKIHNYKDVSFIARIGYWWGFIYAEYRINDILVVPYENAPKLTLGARLCVPIEWW